MRSITANQARAEMRRRRGATMVDVEHLDLFPSSVPSPEQQAIDRDLRDAVREALESLPAAYSMVFRLRELEYLSTAETGARLGLTTECVKTRLGRARSLLRRKLVPKLSGASFASSTRICGHPISEAETAGRRAGCRNNRGPAGAVS